MDRGWNAGRAAFVQHYDTDVLDASLLLMPRSASSPRSDPMWLSTLDAMEEELVTDSLVYRYDPAPRRTGCAAPRAPSRCAPSSTSTRWPAPGRLDEARLTFEKMLTYANHVGLFSEEIARDR